MPMKKCQCQSNPNASRRRRGGEVTGWLLSGATLVMIPKCPACLAGYVALATGIGISFSTATYLRLLVLFLCLGSMGYLAARRIKCRSSITGG